MRLLSRLWLLPVWLAIGMAQTPSSANPDQIDLTADNLARTGDTIRGLGHVKAKFGTILFEADEGAARPETGELELRGHVRATFPAREDRTLFRYSAGNFMTDKPVVVHADHMGVKGSLLQALGNIVVRLVDDESPEGSRIKADEMSMNLRTADATLRGGIEPSYFLSRRPFGTKFPPDIVK